MAHDLLQRVTPGARVAVIRLRSLGDCVLTTPALALLKKHRPDLRIGVVVEDRFAELFAGNPDVDAVLAPTVAAVARWQPELTLNLHGGSTSSQLTFASRARWRAGFDHFRFRALYNIRIPRAQQILGIDRKVHTAEHLASAMFYLGVPSGEIPQARLYVDRGPRARKPYAVLHPMASALEKTWPAAHFLELAEALEIEPVFIAGPGESLEPFEKFRCVAGASLQGLKTLLSRASLFIGNDSGPAHMAAAFGVPAVVLFGPSDPGIWSPWKTECAVLSAQPIESIPPAEVLAAVARLSQVEQTR